MSDETPVLVSLPLMDNTSDAESCFEEQGTDSTFQRTREPEGHPPEGTHKS